MAWRRVDTGRERRLAKEKVWRKEAWVRRTGYFVLVVGVVDYELALGVFGLGFF